MKMLFLLLAGLSASAGITLWQQRAIERTNAALAALSEQILHTRSGLDAERKTQEDLQGRLADLEAKLREAKRARQAAARGAEATPLPTPQQEGYWPSNRPYFYLSKRLLPLARFRNHELTPEEMSPELKASIASDHDHLPEVAITLFNQGELNPIMASLLGMSSEELAGVNQAYADLQREVGALEAARLEMLNPAQPTEDGRSLVARLPDLSGEVAPLQQQWANQLEQLLGGKRAQILTEQAQDYFNQQADGLGTVTREFLYQDNNLWVRYTDAQGHHSMASTTWYLPNYAGGRPYPYSHLFGSNGPCPLPR